MIGVISGLVAVVLLVLMVVALGMRSMNRRESALSAERIKAMAENKGPKPRRPAEETFFESFPAGFDAFEEPAERSKPQRPGSARQHGGRQARAAERGGKQSAPASGARGRRGVDEWGEHDDYDDDYWSRVRADDGGFGGSIAARMATPRPVEQPTDAEAAAAASPVADPNAATAQVPLPQRPVPAGLADLVETSRPTTGSSRSRAKQTPATSSPAVSASALAEQKTVTFSAPTPDVLGTGPSRGRSSRSGSRSARSGGRRSSAAAAAETGQASASGSFETPSAPITGPSAPITGPSAPMPTTGAFTAGSFEAPLGTGPFEATPSPAAPGTGSASPWPPAYEPPAYDASHGDAYDLSRNATGPFSPADTGPSYPVTPVAPVTPEVAPAPGTTTSPGWPSVRDVLDDPEPPRAVSSSWPAVETYQMPQTGMQPPAAPPAYDGYPAATPAGDGTAYGSAQPPASASYEVSAGWASIDESDTVTGPPAAASPYESAGYDVPSGQSYYGHDQRGGYGTGQAATPSWQEQNTGGDPAYDELYGDAPKPTTAHRGSHRNEPETDYPDYYR
ncbi:hypothetical protein ACQP1K_09345 [Sphaerimonospora sp. CA-214678]|uniref:hypothetical protein n=1 Tax=Sphaerimonospora sp. CA-214678 TaxID=3240029 RepID=UPI003D91728E